MNSMEEKPEKIIVSAFEYAIGSTADSNYHLTHRPETEQERLKRVHDNWERQIKRLKLIP